MCLYGNLKDAMGILSFTDCIEMNVLETSLDKGYLYLH